MNKISLYSVVGLIAVTLLSNIFAYPYLPDQIGIHQQAGQIDDYVSKLAFIFLIPCTQVIASILIMTKGKILPLLLFNVGTLILNTFLLYQNI